MAIYFNKESLVSASLHTTWTRTQPTILIFLLLFPVYLKFSHEWYPTNLTVIRITAHVRKLHQNTNRPQEIKKRKRKKYTLICSWVTKADIHNLYIYPYTYLIWSNLHLTHAGSHILTRSYTPNVVYSHDKTQKILYRNSCILTHLSECDNTYFHSTHPSPTHTDILSHIYTQSPPYPYLLYGCIKKKVKKRKEKMRKAHRGIIQSKWPMGRRIR